MSQKRILVAASMGGGASAVAPVVHRLREQGAAVKVLSYGAGIPAFRSKGIEPEMIERASLADVAFPILDFKPDAILTGTQVQDKDNGLITLEQAIWAVAKAHRIKSVAVLDIADNIAERFSDLVPSAPGLVVQAPLNHLPNLITIPEEYTKSRMLQLSFPEPMLVVTGNPGFEQVAIDAAKLSPATRAELLTKPVFADFFSDGKLIVFFSDSWRDFPDIGFTEKSVLQSFLRIVDYVVSGKDNIKANVIVRPHPFRNQEAREAFDGYAPQHVKAVFHNPISVKGIDLANDYTIAQLLHSADIVVGTFNNALIEAAVVRTARGNAKPIINWVPGIMAKYETPPYDYQHYLWGQAISRKLKGEKDLVNMLRTALRVNLHQNDLPMIKGATDRVIALLD